MYEMEYDYVYVITGVDPVDGQMKEWHRTSTSYGAEVAYDAAFDAGWTKIRIDEDCIPVREE